jgi:hypothetical protein
LLKKVVAGSPTASSLAPDAQTTGRISNDAAPTVSRKPSPSTTTSMRWSSHCRVSPKAAGASPSSSASFAWSLLRGIPERQTGA